MPIRMTGLPEQPGDGKPSPRSPNRSASEEFLTARSFIENAMQAPFEQNPRKLERHPSRSPTARISSRGSDNVSSSGGSGGSGGIGGIGGSGGIFSGRAPSAAGAAFAEFAAATDVAVVQAKFAQLMKEVGCEAALQAGGKHVLQALVEAVPRLPPRLRELVLMVHRRSSHAQYGGCEQCARLRTTILGGGPVGLRCAVELALLGSPVTVIESRASWTRLNVLHLWAWVEADLTELGVNACRV